MDTQRERCHHAAHMRIFALETDLEKLKRKYVSANEQEVMTIRYHGFVFFLRLVRDVFASAVLLALGITLDLLGIPLLWIIIPLGFLWIFFVLFKTLQSYIDWRYDCIIVTSNKVVIVDQTSVFHVEVRQMHLENFASVNASTQFLNLLPFGRLCFDLKEGIGQRFCVKYVPDAENVAAKISSYVEAFARGEYRRPEVATMPESAA